MLGPPVSGTSDVSLVVPVRIGGSPAGVVAACRGIGRSTDLRAPSDSDSTSGEEIAGVADAASSGSELPVVGVVMSAVVAVTGEVVSGTGPTMAAATNPTKQARNDHMARFRVRNGRKG